MFEALGRLFTGGSKKETGPTLEQLYDRFLVGALGQRELFAALREDQVATFCDLHQARSQHAGEGEGPTVVFKRNQLDRLVVGDGGELRKKVIEAHGGTTISQWN